MIPFNQTTNYLIGPLSNADIGGRDQNTTDLNGIETAKIMLNSGQKVLVRGETINNFTDEITNATELIKSNNSLFNELNLKYSLIFVINFQVILFNALIIINVLKAKKFQKSSSARYFVLSLAVSDLLVGILVMPIGIISFIKSTWLFGKEACIFWQLIDFFCCTASIFNLCTVSFDRYIALSRPLLYMRMSPRRVITIIGIVWLISALITFPPAITERLTKGQSYLEGICKGPNCSNCESLLDYYPVYVIFSSILSFFLPVILVIITNYRTYLIVKRHMFARANNGSLPANPANNKEKTKKVKLNLNLLTRRKENSRQIELNSLENQLKKPVPIMIGSQSKHHIVCCCDKDNGASYFHTKATNKYSTCARITQCFNWLLRRDNSNVESKIIESKIIHTAHQNHSHYSSCKHFEPDLNSSSSTGERNRIEKLARCLNKCCTLNGFLVSRKSRLSNDIKNFFVLNNNSNIKMFDDIDNLDSLKTCAYCALNSLNASIQFHNTNHHYSTRNDHSLNEDLLTEEESTSGRKNRMTRSERGSFSILVNVNSRSESSNTNNDEIADENFSIEAKQITDTSNGGLMNRCLEENVKGSPFMQAKNCCGYCCTLCSPECQQEFRSDSNINRLILEIFNSKTNQKIKLVHKNSKTDSKENSCKISFNKPSTTTTGLTSRSDKSCKPQHHLNCSHFKIDQHSLNNSKQFIRCDYCGSRFSSEQSTNTKSKKICLHRFANGSPKNMGKQSNEHSASKIYYQVEHKCCQFKCKLNNNVHQINHHCIHSHIQLLSNHLTQICTDPLSSESNRNEELTQSAGNSGGRCEQASSSSDYRRANNNSSFDDELRINCGTGQLQKSIGVNWVQQNQANRQIGGTSSTNSDGNSSRNRSTAKLKKLAHFAGVRNVGFQRNSNNGLNTIRREYKATKTLAIITFVFVSMWLPYFIIFLLEAICKECSVVKAFFSPFLPYCLFLGWSNSYVNCLLYMYFSKKLRKSIINSLLCRKN